MESLGLHSRRRLGLGHRSPARTSVSLPVALLLLLLHPRSLSGQLSSKVSPHRFSSTFQGLEEHYLSLLENDVRSVSSAHSVDEETEAQTQGSAGICSSILVHTLHLCPESLRHRALNHHKGQRTTCSTRCPSPPPGTSPSCTPSRSPSPWGDLSLGGVSASV